VLYTRGTSALDPNSDGLGSVQDMIGHVDAILVRYVIFSLSYGG
jgi:hypothetical protein